MRLGYRRFLVPGLSTLVMLAVLVGLGTWQVYRLRWKEGILAQIAAAEAQPPVTLAQYPEPFTKVTATGRFRFDRAVRFGAEVRDTRAGPVLGFFQIVPLERTGAPPILVNRGWIPQKRDAPLDDPTGVETVTGYLRAGEVARWFSPANDAAARQFYTLDPQTIGAAIGVTDPAPLTLIAMGPTRTGSYPAPTQHLPRPPNNHLSYVITWYGLAVSLVVVFCVWVRKASRP